MSTDINLWYLIAHPGSASITLETPAFLALAAASCLLFYVARRDSVRQRAAMWCRIVAFCLVVLALAGLTLATRLPDDRLSLIAVLDASQSIDDEGRAWQERYLERAEQALAPGDEIGVIKFGRDAVVVRPPGTQRSNPLGDEALRPSATDIGKALDTAMALFPPDVERRILLLSDGNETRGSSITTIPRAVRSKVSIFAAVPPHGAGADASVEKLIVPPVVAEGAVFPVRVVLRNRGKPRDAMLSLQLDGDALGQERIELRQGLNAVEIPYRMQGTGARKLRATIFAPEDSVRANDYREEALTVGSEPRVMVVSTRARPPLAVVLERKDVGISVQRPEGLPSSAEQLARYDAVILEDVVAADLDGAKLNAIERYVRELGGGLVVAGGRMTYGDEHFKGTALERLLPVSLEPRRPPRVEREPLALFLLIDVSNSMGYHFRDRLQRSESQSKLVYAKRAALAVLSQLKDTDYVGVLIFNSGLTEVAPLRRLAENRSLLDREIPKLQPGGGTDFFDALESAHQQLVDARISTKHVILLTDGDTNRDAEGHRQLIDSLARDSVSVSTIRIGDDMVNLRLLTDISTRTGGQFYHVENAETLPELMLKDTTKALAQVERSGESYVPRVAAWSQILGGIDARHLPELRGYAYSRPRPTADVLLDVAVEGRNDPILAVWQYGLGRVAAFTASIYDDAEMWIGWDGLGKLWSQIGRWTARSYSPWNYAVDIERSGRESTLTVRSFGDLGDGVLRARLRPHPDRQIEVALVPQAPRVFTAQLPTLLGGKYPVTIVRRTASGDVSELTQTVTFPAKDMEPQDEFLADGPNTLLLNRLTTATGGALEAPLREVVRREPGTRRVEHRLDWLLIPLAMVLFLGDVALRRFEGSSQAEPDLTSLTSLTGRPVRLVRRVRRLEAPPANRDNHDTAMKILYFDAFSGISGDMTVGALLSLGMPLDHLRAELSKLALDGYRISAAPRMLHSIEATKFDVVIDHRHDGEHVHEHESQRHTHRAYRDIRAMIEKSQLATNIKDRALAIFSSLAKAEGKVHAVAVDDVQFHEVGAIDSIVDIAGAAIGLEFFAADRILVSSLPLGSGIVDSQHGPIPVPGPATAELLRGFVTRPGDGEGEMVTPTGAAIVATVAEQETLPDLRIENVGYGAGQRSLRDRPNLLRLILGETAASTDHDDIIVIETNIDDYNPELYEYVVERLLHEGARDVYLTPVQMKKGRPGVILSVLCAPAERQALGAIVLAETSAIGLRYYPARRMMLAREIRQVATVYGTVRVKVARGPDGHENLAPEYDDCKRIAAEKQVPIKLVYQAALVAAAGASRG